MKAGGAAALHLALAYIAAMPFFVLVVDYQGATNIADKVALIVGNYASMYATYLVTYVFFGIILGGLVFALYDRMRDFAPSTARITAAIGPLWAFALDTSGMVFNFGMTTIVALAKTVLAQVGAVWQGIEPVAEAPGGAGGEVLGGVWVLLVSWMAVRSGALPQALGWLGVAVGAMGLVSVVRFGLLQIVWFVWLGVVMTTKAPAAEKSSTPERALWRRRAASGRQDARLGRQKCLRIHVDSSLGATHGRSTANES